MSWFDEKQKSSRYRYLTRMQPSIRNTRAHNMINGTGNNWCRTRIFLFLMWNDDAISRLSFGMGSWNFFHSHKYLRPIHITIPLCLVHKRTDPQIIVLQLLHAKIKAGWVTGHHHRFCAVPTQNIIWFCYFYKIKSDFVEDLWSFASAMRLPSAMVWSVAPAQACLHLAPTVSLSKLHIVTWKSGK